MQVTGSSEAFRALRIGSALFSCAAIAIVLLVFRQWAAAGGVMIGCLLYVGNSLLLVEIGRALLAGSRGARTAAAFSAVGRFILLGLALAAAFLFLGREAGIGACGGLFVSQVNLHRPIRRTGVAT
jgi:hypothetical protein